MTTPLDIKNALEEYASKNEDWYDIHDLLWEMTEGDVYETDIGPIKVVVNRQDRPDRDPDNFISYDGHNMVWGLTAIFEHDGHFYRISGEMDSWDGAGWNIDNIEEVALREKVVQEWTAV